MAEAERVVVVGAGLLAAARIGRAVAPRERSYHEHPGQPTRAALYRALGLRLTYEKQTTGQELVRARLQLSGGGGGMGALASTATTVPLAATLILS